MMELLGQQERISTARSSWRGCQVLQTAALVFGGYISPELVQLRNYDGTSLDYFTCYLATGDMILVEQDLILQQLAGGG
jgi:hypothetical protein